MFPLPVTVDCTTPCPALRPSRVLRAELVGGPIWVIARATTATSTAASAYNNHGLDGRSRRLFIRDGVLPPRPSALRKRPCGALRNRSHRRRDDRRQLDLHDETTLVGGRHLERPAMHMDHRADDREPQP